MDELTGRSVIGKREGEGEKFGGGSKARNRRREGREKLQKRTALGVSRVQGVWESRRQYLKKMMKPSG